MKRTLRRLGPDLGLLCASVIAAGAVARLFQGGLGGPALTPLLVTAAVGCAVPSLLALTSVPVAIRAVAGTLAVILTSLWTSFANATSFGIPTARTWHALVPQLRAARPLVSQFAVPLHPSSGLVFLAAVGCGEVALLASVLLRVGDDDAGGDRRIFPGLALLSPLGLLAFACAQSTPGSMVLPVIFFVAAAALTLVAARAHTARARSLPTPAAAPQRHDLRRWVTPGVLTAATMAAVVLVATLVGSDDAGAGTSGAGVAPAVPLTAESLTSKLLSVEVHDANVVLFQASSRVRTYWQVAVLDDLRDGVWVPDAQTERAAQHSGQGGSASSPGPNVTTSGRQLVKSDVTISGLTSRLLPVPPGTFALSGSDAALTNVGAVATLGDGARRAVQHRLGTTSERPPDPWRRPGQCGPAGPRAGQHRVASALALHRAARSINHERRRGPLGGSRGARELVPLRPVPLHARPASEPARHRSLGQLLDPDAVGYM